MKVLVSTNIASRGLDLPPVGHVVQFDMPISLEDFDNYIYRLGRVERGRATSFYVPGREVGVGNDKIYRQLISLLEEYRQVSFIHYLSQSFIIDCLTNIVQEPLRIVFSSSNLFAFIMQIYHASCDSECSPRNNLEGNGNSGGF